MAGVVGDVDVRALLQEDGNGGVAVADRARDHQRCPAGVVWGVDCGFGLGQEELDDGEMVVCQGPVDRDAVVVIAEIGEFGVCLRVAVGGCLLRDG